MFKTTYLLCKRRDEKEGIKWNTFEYKKLLPKLKGECHFLKSTPSHALQQAVINLGKVYENFFKRRAGFLELRKKKGNSIYLPQALRYGKKKK
ncbi:MAG: hypothetical protein QXF86_04730 [Candidatus Bilamarchaeaceae archaeon]